MMVSSVDAVPLLNVGSNANYQLSAIIQSTQSCGATPTTTTQVNYTQLACGPYQPRNLVSIYDNGTCVSINTCYYSSYYYYYQIPLGTTVMWFNYGTVSHTVTSSPTNSPSLQPLNSGPLAH